MLKKLSRIFGIAGSLLTMLPYIVFIWYCVKTLITPVREPVVEDGKGMAFVFLLMYIVPALLSPAGIIASFFVGKRPVAAGAAMILSSALNLLTPPNYFFTPAVVFAVKVIAALLLIYGGAFAIISRLIDKKAPGGEPQTERAAQPAVEKGSPALKKLSRIIAVICASLHMLPWAVFIAIQIAQFLKPERYELSMLLYTGVPLFISAAGLWGSLLLRKSPAIGAALMFISGGLVYFFLSYYYYLLPYPLFGIPTLLLIAAAVFALICTGNIFTSRKPPKITDPALIERRRLMCRNLSRIVGIIFASFNTLLWVFLIVRLIAVWPGSEPYQQKIYSSEFVPFLIVPFLFSLAGLWGSLLLRRKPVPGAVIILVSGGAAFLLMLIAHFALIWQNAPPLLLAAAGVFAIISNRKASVSEKPQNPFQDNKGGALC